MTKIKICGLSRPVDIDYVNQQRPDFMGFVFAPKSRRYVNFERAAALRARLIPEIKAVGVFVNALLDDVVGLVERGTIDWVQLHGSEDEAYIAELRKRVQATIVQAFKVTSADDVARAKASTADYILLDNGAGGTGQTFDWSVVANVGRPFFLAGGLGPENVAEAVTRLRPWSVDLSSGVETDGVKDFVKICDVISRVRSTDEQL